MKCSSRFTREMVQHSSKELKLSTLHCSQLVSLMEANSSIPHLHTFTKDKYQHLNAKLL